MTTCTRRSAVALLATFMLAPGATGQFVVPGTHDTIQAAIDEAEDGFEILVLPGSYAPFDIGYDHAQGLIVRSAEGADVTSVNVGEGQWVSLQEPLGENTLEGFTFEGGGYVFVDGRHHIRSNVFRGGSFSLTYPAGMTVADCAIVDGAEMAVQFAAGLSVVRCRFENGRGMRVSTSREVVVRDSVFEGNARPEFLGGAFGFSFGEDSGPTLERCIFRNNSAEEGGAVQIEYATFNIVDCVFEGNIATLGSGGAIAVGRNDWPPASTITRCVFEGNSAAQEGGALLLTDLDEIATVVTDSRFCDNAPQNVSGPMADGGGNSGCCPADVTLGGSVDFDDVLAILAAWGPCPSDGSCAADIDGDGNVGFGDVLEVLVGWGDCPPLK